MTIRIHDFGHLRPFRDAQEIAGYFELTRSLSDDEFERLKAASDAGTPAFVAVNPYAAEINDVRVLFVENTLESLRHRTCEAYAEI